MKRTISVLLCIVMVISCMPAIAVFAASSRTLAEALEWLDDTVGTTQGNGQCVGLIKEYYKYLGVSEKYGNANTYAIDVPPDGWNKIENATPQAGDILVWVDGYNGYGHVAICGGSNRYYHQNWNENEQYVEILNKSYTGGFSIDGGAYYANYWGVIRPEFADHPAEHTCDFSEYLGYWADHPHCNYYGCSICGAEWHDRSSSNYLEGCQLCREHTCDFSEYLGYWADHPHCNYYGCSICGAEWHDKSSSNYLEGCQLCREHTCDFSEYLGYWADHPHCNYYGCSLCGVEWADLSSSNYHESCLVCNMPSKPSLNEMEGEYIVGRTITFTWAETENTTHYNFWLYRKAEDGSWMRAEHLYNVENGFELLLERGEYRALLQAYNSAYRFEDGRDWLYAESEYFEFSVVESKTTLGDVNEDGELSITDVIVLLKYLAGSGAEISEAAADMNGDGSISLADVVSMMKQFLK